MPTNGNECHTSIQRFKSVIYELIDQLDFVPNEFFKTKQKKYQVPDYRRTCENTQQVD
jgi:hypothetical protein